MSVHPALFLDRDGVIIRNRPDYVKSKDEVSFYETALRALALLAGSKYKIIVVTNQSAVPTVPRTGVPAGSPGPASSCKLRGCTTSIWANRSSLATLGATSSPAGLPESQ